MKSNVIYKRPDEYTQASNKVIRDTRLSWKARGLYTFLASVATVEGWSFDREWIIKQSKEDGRTAYNNGIKELKKYGYLNIKAVREENGTFNGWKWFLNTQPVEEDEPKDGKPEFRLSRTSAGPSESINNDLRKNEVGINTETEEEKNPEISTPEESSDQNIGIPKAESASFFTDSLSAEDKLLTQALPPEFSDDFELKKPTDDSKTLTNGHISSDKKTGKDWFNSVMWESVPPQRRRNKEQTWREILKLKPDKAIREQIVSYFNQYKKLYETEAEGDFPSMADPVRVIRDKRYVEKPELFRPRKEEHAVLYRRYVDSLKEYQRIKKAYAENPTPENKARWRVAGLANVDAHNKCFGNLDTGRYADLMRWDDELGVVHI